jgi:G:T-mismatch repair DNA endonuclease (very short patch repair protein)
MILEEETFKKFGYYPCDLTRRSGKRILAACDKCGKIREINKDSYCACCKSCAQKGGNNNNYGKIPSNETRIKMSGAQKGRKFSLETIKKMCAAQKGEKHRRWQGDSVIHKCPECGRDFYLRPWQIKKGWGKFCSRSCSLKASKRNSHPQKTYPELIFEDICKQNGLPFKYTGNRTVWLGNANPDFVHNTRKLVCEVFGDFWHSPLLRRNLRYNETLEGRREQLKAEGYKLIVIWESDLKRKDAEPFVLYTLKKHKIYPSITGEE